MENGEDIFVNYRLERKEGRGEREEAENRIER